MSIVQGNNTSCSAGLQQAAGADVFFMYDTAIEEGVTREYTYLRNGNYCA
ncbi:MAG: hypothetical protein K0R57_5007 [Paenibacillaceae bacterium]|jgi:hypothetical protein|nr:hypothetical protein [Paenibacillaceae bacterium]